MISALFPPPCHRKGKPPSWTAVERHRVLSLELGRMVNGPVFGGVLTHFCHPSVGCGCSDRSESIRRVSTILCQTLFRRKPAVPQLKEWTAVQQSVEFVALGCCLQGVHRRVFEASVSPLVNHAPRATDAADAGHAAAALALVPAAHLGAAAPSASASFENVGWHETNGKRVQYIRRHLMQPAEDLRILALSLLLGAEEEVSAFFFRRKDQFETQRPLLVMLASPQFNPALPLTQFVSSVLAGEHLSCALLSRARGFRDLGQMLMGDAEGSALVRLAFTNSAAIAYVRHFHKFAQWPWRLAAVVDAEIDEPSRMSVAQAFCSACPKCLDAGFGRQLRRRVWHPEDLLEPAIQEAILIWACCHDGDTHDVEIKHALNKRQNTALTKFEMLAARYVAADAKSSLRNSAPAPAPSPAPAPLLPPPKRRRSSQVCWCKSGVQYYHRVAVRRDRAAGCLHDSPASQDPGRGGGYCIMISYPQAHRRHTTQCTTLVQGP